jgi:glucan biosynthesis protein
MPRYQVAVRVKAIYEVEAKNGKEAEAIAIKAASNSGEESPDFIEYDGDGVDEVTQVTD